MPPELFERPAFSLTPQQGRSGPKLWIRRLAIWQDPTVILRDVALRPGLNIIWSPDSQNPDSPIGHGGGKTTFCRLLRFCLGEDSFAPETLRHRIGDVFPKGHVGAEIVLDGQTWIVLRALGHRRRDIVHEGGSFEDAFSHESTPTGMAPLREALTRSVMGSSAMLIPPSIGAEGAWKALLAWITRDQECRFGSALSWRSPESDSLSPVVNRSAEDKLLIVRAAIGALAKPEITAQQQEERLREKLTGNRSYLGRLEWQLGRTRKNISDSLKTNGTLAPGTPMDISLLRKAAADRLSKTLNLPSRVNPGDVARARQERQLAKEEVDRLQNELKFLQGEITSKREIKTFISSELPVAYARTLNEKNPVCPICKVPIDKVLAEGCGISTETCDVHALQLEIRRKQSQISELDEEISSLRKKDPIVRGAIARARREFEEVDKALLALERSLDDSSKSIRAAQRLIEDVDQYESLVAESDRAHLAEKRIEADLIRRRESVATHRDSTSATISRLSTWFDIVLRELVPGDVRGTAKLDGNGLKLSVELGGDRSTAAIDSLKVVAFDLAILAMSMESSLHLPGILVHDSPREADLSKTIYDRIFRFAATLEKCSSVPCFQYVLTTTTAPPEDFQTEPWVRLTVKGAPAEERLLKVDL